MGIVKEEINFERGKDPKSAIDIGKESRYSREKRLKAIEDKYPHRFNDEGERDKALDIIDLLEKIINKLEELEVPITKIIGSLGLDIQIKVWEILDSNHVILHCLSEKDAQKMIEILRMGSFRNNDNFSYEQGESYVDIKEGVLEWLENAETYREHINRVL